LFYHKLLLYFLVKYFLLKNTSSNKNTITITAETIKDDLIKPIGLNKITINIIITTTQFTNLSRVVAYKRNKGIVNTISLKLNKIAINTSTDIITGAASLLLDQITLTIKHPIINANTTKLLIAAAMKIDAARTPMNIAFCFILSYSFLKIKR